MEINSQRFHWWKYLRVSKYNSEYIDNKYPIDITAFYANPEDILHMKSYLPISEVATRFITPDESIPNGMLLIDMEHVFIEPSIADIEFDTLMQEEAQWRSRL